MSNNKSYVKVSQHGAGWDDGCFELTLIELEDIVNKAKLNGATKVEVTAGQSASLYFYREQTNDEYNYELQGRIDEKLSEVDEMEKSILLV